ncbi:MAG: hypothetical protein SLAVMIC_01028 [uncultured marine phage]|uniref:Uncharacterized protein n=1 Tax=uncultured marine phage TaxID=707152 RepID=A0A8D9CCI9_9VIRU|nr:MAG: hypothetical protein SLAVMIC_01028 [uncultured marine phage]
MLKLCRFESTGHSYDDIVLYDDQTNKFLILESLTDNNKFNGCIFSPEPTGKFTDLDTFKLDHFNGKEVTIDDLINSEHFTVVINGDTILSKPKVNAQNYDNNGKIMIFKFKEKDSITYETKMSEEDYPFHEIKSIKANLIFKKKGL